MFDLFQLVHLDFGIDQDEGVTQDQLKISLQ